MTSQHLNVHHIVRSVAAPEGAADRRARAVWAGGSGGRICLSASVRQGVLPSQPVDVSRWALADASRRLSQSSETLTAVMAGATSPCPTSGVGFPCTPMNPGSFLLPAKEEQSRTRCCREKARIIRMVSSCVGAAGSAVTPVSNSWAQSPGGVNVCGPPGSKTDQLSRSSVSSSNGGEPHENRPPFSAVNFIICIQGA